MFTGYWERQISLCINTPPSFPAPQTPHDTPYASSYPPTSTAHASIFPPRCHPPDPTAPSFPDPPYGETSHSAISAGSCHTHTPPPQTAWRPLCARGRACGAPAAEEHRSGRRGRDGGLSLPRFWGRAGERSGSLGRYSSGPCNQAWSRRSA